MSPGQQSEHVKQVARDTGFDLCRIAPAAAHPRSDFLRAWLASGRAGTMGYLHRHVESRIDVRAWLPWAQSVIVTALNYHRPPPARDDRPTGRVASYAWGDDYHDVVRKKLEALVHRLRAELPEPFQARITVDTSAVIEREIAAAAGLGWIGKNTLVIHPDLGSYFFLGEIITDLPLAPDAPEPDHCGSCTRCLDACPTGAFPEAYVMDARRCISYLTIEHRGEIEPDLAAKMEDWVFGCDICQAACPFNRHAPEAGEPRFQVSGPAETSAFPPLDEIAVWDEETYRARTAGKATRRARREMWQRNAAIARRNRTSDAGPAASADQSTNSTPTR